MLDKPLLGWYAYSLYCKFAPALIKRFPDSAELSPFVEVGVFMQLFSLYYCIPSIRGVLCLRIPPVGVSCCEARSFFTAMTGSAKLKPILGDCSLSKFYWFYSMSKAVRTWLLFYYWAAIGVLVKDLLLNKPWVFWTRIVAYSKL